MPDDDAKPDEQPDEDPPAIGVIPTRVPWDETDAVDDEWEDTGPAELVPSKEELLASMSQQAKDDMRKAWGDNWEDYI